MSRRDQIKPDPDEVIQLMSESEIVTVSTNGPRGWPHTMPLWFLERDGEIWVWTYCKSQKVKNLERDPRATALIEAGENYAELRGIMVEAEVDLYRDAETVGVFARELGTRYAARIGLEPAAAAESFLPQVAKRVAIRFRPVRAATWDHRKLAGTY